MKQIENLLYEKTKDTKSEILYSQWSYDKKIIPKALNAISSLFPHYSLHDESHSITIINNIIRILGRNAFSKLSAIDLWLILEASYYHDIGMVVSAKEINELVESDGFINFFIEILNNPKHNLYTFAKYYKIENDKIVYASTMLNLKQHDGIKFILAEYFRRQHSDRSEEIINSPDQKFSLSSPRSAIPDRIFATLGKICACHTKDFDQVMQLSYCEVGIDMEDMHPRFIACLLRIGDLLDLDNDRFSDVMLSTLSQIPIDTITHKSMHMSIQSFRADKNEISIFAKCKDYDAAEVTQHWFDYINNEITNQMSNWNIIVPMKDLGYLPSIKSLKVVLYPYEYIDGKNKPKFTIDTSKALDLLSGAGIYNKPEQSFREILQNAVDSTLIRIWEEHKDNKAIFNEPCSSEFTELIKNYPIKVSINSKKVDQNKKNWNIVIEDNAMGFSAADLKCLMKAGSSSKNNKKNSIVRSMPKWLQPSGIFGIGFQSIFQLTEEVKIRTKDFFNEQYKEITLYSPNSSRNGAILLEKKNSSHAIKPGSKICFNYKTNTIPLNYSYGFEKNYATQTIDNYDYFTSDSFDIEIAQVIDEIHKFSSHSYFPIELSLDDIDLPLNNNEEKPFDYYDKDSLLELNIFPNTDAKYVTSTYFKNQEVKNNLSLQFIGLAVNIHTETATKVLTLNRNEIRSEYRSILRKYLFEAILRIIKQNYNIFTDEQKIYLSMFLNYYYPKDIKDLIEYDNYKNLKFSVGDKEKTISDLLILNKFIINFYQTFKVNEIKKYLEIEEDCLIINCNSRSNINEKIEFLLFKAKDNFKSITGQYKDRKYTFTLDKTIQKNPYSNDDYKKIIKNLSKNTQRRRIFLPCMIEQYNHLRLKDNAYAPWVSDSDSLSRILNMPKMLSPFITENGEVKELTNEKVVNWVYDNKHNSATSKDHIRDEYDKFIKEFYTDLLCSDSEK